MSATIARASRQTRAAGAHSGPTIDELRRQIDAIDTQILRLLTQRADLALRVGRVKKLEGKRVFDPTREQTVLRRIAAANRGPLSAGAIEKIFREIVRQHRRLAQFAQLPR